VYPLRVKSLASKQVLIADDDSRVRRIMKAILARTDVVVCGEAGNGREAIEKAKALKPDLILLDLAMPEMNGAEAASVLKKEMPEVPIIVFTMYDESIGRYLMSAVGVDVVLSKPDGVTQLVSAVESIFDRKPGSSGRGTAGR
jgi:DNA-binding NarL/FixJ family response regulator